MSNMDAKKNLPSEEETFEIPSSLVKNKTGFSFDIGGSCIKLVYSLGERGKREDSIVVRMKSYSSTQLKEAMEFLKERLGSVIESGQKIFTTGVGCHIDQNFITSSLKIELVNVSEMDCFVEAFRFLVSNYSVDQITHDRSAVEVEYRDRLMYQIQMTVMQQLSLSPDKGTISGQYGVENTDSRLIESEMKKDAAVLEKNKSLNTGTGQTELVKEPAGATVKESGPAKEQSKEFQYPCIIAMMGSGGGIIKVEKDSFMVLDGMTRCGRTFLGLGSLLIGCKSFEELIDLASKGNDENVTVIAKHLKSHDTSDIYGQMPDDLVLYCFGKAVGCSLADFKKEDLAACLLSTIAQDLAQATHLNSHVLQVDTVFFCGSFVGQSQLVRDTIGKYFGFRTMLDPFNRRLAKDHYFLRFGGYLGALGCLLRNLNKDRTTDVQPEVTPF